MSSLKRPNYFDGQMLQADTFRLEQAYHRDKLRRHNQVAHGHGVARGLTVSLGGPTARPQVTVKPGAGIDPEGNELELESARCLAITLKANALLVVIALQERLVDPVPLRDAVGASEEIQYARVEEVSDVALMADDAPPTERCDGLVLGRFIRGRSGWRKDPQFKQARLRR